MNKYLHKIWWHYSDDWPYELPANKKRWVPTWLNEWLGKRGGYWMQLWRPYCWITGQHRGAKRREACSYGACVYCRKHFPEMPQH